MEISLKTHCDAKVASSLAHLKVEIMERLLCSCDVPGEGALREGILEFSDGVERRGRLYFPMSLQIGLV